MEIKLVHPSDPEQKVITLSDEIKVAAFKSVGFVEADDLRALGADNETDDLVKKLEDEIAAREAAEAKVEDLKKELKAARQRSTREAKQEAKATQEQEEVPKTAPTIESENE